MRVAARELRRELVGKGDNYRVAAGLERLAEPVDLEDRAHAALAPGSPQPG